MMEVGERCMAERRKDRVSVNAWLFGVGFAKSSSVVVSFSPELAEAMNGNQRAFGIQTE